MRFTTGETAEPDGVIALADGLGGTSVAGISDGEWNP